MNRPKPAPDPETVILTLPRERGRELRLSVVVRDGRPRVHIALYEAEGALWRLCVGQPVTLEPGELSAVCEVLRNVDVSSPRRDPRAAVAAALGRFDVRRAARRGEHR